MKKLSLAAILILSFSALAGQLGGGNPFGGGGRAGQVRGGGAARGPGNGTCLIGNQNFGDGTEDTAAPRKIDPGFVFARLKYHTVPWHPGRTGIPGLGGWGEVPWHHGYRFADSYFPDSLARLTLTTTNDDSYQIVDVDSPEIFKYPFIYMSEPGYLDLTAADARNLREYFDRGGFMMVDDFRGVRDGNPDDNYEYDNMVFQFGKVFPQRHIAPLPADHEIFHIFYDIDSQNMLPSYTTGNTGDLQFLGYSDDKGRLDVMVDYNTDIRQYWQGLELAKCSLHDSAVSVELGVNIAVYAMTH
jgi:hypothetical protein